MTKHESSEQGITLTHGEVVALTLLAEMGFTMTYREIADETELAIGTVRNYTVRWRRKGLVAVDESSVRIRIGLTHLGVAVLKRAGVEFNTARDPRDSTDATQQDILTEQPGTSQVIRALVEAVDRLSERQTETAEHLEQIKGDSETLASAANLAVELRHENEILAARLTSLPDYLHDQLERAALWGGREAELATVLKAVSNWKDSGRPTDRLDVLASLVIGDPSPIRLRDLVNNPENDSVHV